MKRRTYILLVCGFLSAGIVFGQCPERDSLWKRLVYLRDSATISEEEQLKELLVYAGSIAKCPYRNDSTHALLMQRIGVLYFGQSDYIKALQFIKQSIDIINTETTRSLTNARHLIRDYYILSRIYGVLNRAFDKMTAIDSCVNIAVRSKLVDRYSLFPLIERVEYFFNVGENQSALNYASMGESLTRQYMHGKDSMNYVANFLNWKINALIDYKYYDSAENLLSNKIYECKRIGAISYLGTIYQNLAMIKVYKKEFSVSYAHFQKALYYHEKRKYNQGTIETLTNLGFFLYFTQNRDNEKAIATYRRALGYTEADKSHRGAYSVEALNLWANIANVFVQQQNFDSAFYYFRIGLNQVKPGMTEESIPLMTQADFVQLKKIELLTALLIDMADAYKKQFEATGKLVLVNKAIRLYKITDQLLDKIKMEQSELLSKLLWRSKTHSLYEHAIECCYLAHKTDEALYFFEKSRAVILNDQLKEQHWLGEEKILKQTQEKKRIANLENELNDSRTTLARKTEIQAEIVSRKQEMNNLLRVIKIDNPLYYQSFLDTGFITFTDIRANILKDHEALIEVFSAVDAMYFLTVTKLQTYLSKVDKASFDSLAGTFISYVSNPMLLNRNYTSFINVSSGLYRIIFQNTPVPKGRIVVSPDGYYFPFEALITEIKEGVPKYFLAEHAVSYSYSARYLVNNFEKETDIKSKDFLGMAPVRFPFNLTTLAGSDNSLNRIKKYVGDAFSFTSTHASRSNFLNDFYNYKVVQLYTHGASKSDRGEPVIWFSDSALYLSELNRERLPATDLVVLSACETGTGLFYQGEGVFGFNRGFAALGISASVTNLWAVENESTYKITELFYKYLSQNLPTDISLQKAKLEFLENSSKEKKLPYYWAAAILVGKSDTVLPGNSFHWMYSILWASVILLVLAGLWVWRKQTNQFISNVTFRGEGTVNIKADKG